MLIDALLIDMNMQAQAFAVQIIFLSETRN